MNKNAHPIAAALHSANAPALDLDSQARLRRLHSYWQNVVIQANKAGEKEISAGFGEYLQALDFVLTVETLRAGMRAENPG